MVEVEVVQSEVQHEPWLEMPQFELRAYEALLDRFAEVGYTTRVISELDERDEPSRVLYLRHDLDFLVGPSLAFATVEAERHMRATYYVLLTGPYNAFAVENRVDLRTLVALGHEVGLHYDLRTMTGPTSELRGELAVQRRALEDLIGREVTTISMHNPSISGDDPFRMEPGLRHPHDPRDSRGITYVSDSCRRWRDDSLLACFGPAPPPRAMLLTHPELWLAAEIQDPAQYLRECVTTRALTPLRSYFEHEVAAIWRARHAVSADSTRSTRLELWDRTSVEASLDAIERRFAQFVELPWGRDEILADRPGKWKHTFVALVDDDIAGFSFNSVRDGWLYVHAFFVGPEHRHRGLGRLLIEAVSRRAGVANLSGVRLRVATTNTTAINFYLQCGFAIECDELAEGQLVMARAGARAAHVAASS